ncbi:MAG: putative bifunctional diguanylate cyclase/phosphodiesterase [Acidimicrobiales bacterium]
MRPGEEAGSSLAPDGRAPRPPATSTWASAARGPEEPGPGARRSLRAGLALVLAPPLVALVALSVVAVLSYQRAESQVRDARRAVIAAPGGPGAGPAAAAGHLDQALTQSRRARLAIAGGLLGALGLALAAAVQLNRRLVRPVRTAQRAARRVDAGETGVRLDPSADGELGDLASAMNAMAARLDSSRPTLFAAAVVEHSPDLVMVVEPVDDGDGTRWVIRYANPAADTMLGRPSQWLAGNPVAAIVHPEDRDKLVEILRSPSAPEVRTQVAAEIRLSHVHGRWVAVEVAASDLLDDPMVAGVVLHARDLFERRAEEEELRHMALHDPLTRLANRTVFTDNVELALNQDLRTAVRPHAVLIVDLDGFKTINDSLGHATGDRVLVELADRLRTRVRPGDTAARLGGDEFGVLLENSSEEDAAVVAGRILDALSDPVSVANKNVVITGSVGIALSEAGQDAEDLMRNADVAMYRAKSEGKNRHQVFRREMQEAVSRRLDLEADLRRAIDCQELVLHYQPIVDLTSYEVVGLEVLVRWQRGAGALLAPGAFIEVAEDSGLIRPMGRWVLAEACRQQQLWAGWEPGQPPLTIAVNVSPLQVDGPAFVEEVAATLESTGASPASLTLEITESVFMRDFATKVERLRRLRALGVKVAIDDFGTGWSSFSRLKHMPIDILKIDKAFVDGVTKGAEDSAVAQAIVKLARTMGLQTVAEGIEHLEQAERLADMKCDLGQGFWFARPMPAESVEALVHRRRLMSGPPGSGPAPTTVAS